MNMSGRGCERVRHESNHRKLIIRYLLGQLPEEELSRFEKCLLADDQLFAELVVVENEMIDCYVEGDLSRQERESFERHYLISAGRRRRVEFAKALIRVTSMSSAGSAPPPSGTKPRSWWQRR